MSDPKPLGRPPLDRTDRSVEVSISVPARQLAAAEEHAKQGRMTLQDFVRHLIRHATDETKSG